MYSRASFHPQRGTEVSSLREWLGYDYCIWLAQNASQGGVGILMSSNAYKSINNVECSTERIITAHFEGNPGVSVMCSYHSYAPTNCSNDKIADDFYQRLTEEIKLIPKHNVFIVARRGL